MSPSAAAKHISVAANHRKPLFTLSWSLFQAGKSLELVDASLEDKWSPDETAICIQLGLLCCQASIADRPDMNSIHLMLSSNSFTLPIPGNPGVHGRVGQWTTTTSAPFTCNTTGNTTQTGDTKASTTSVFNEDYSRNSMSYSSVDEGR
ncbi:hypothetical protein BUALT_Bualt02G0078200 [Buddleja alternifolia]|uniref:Uncharacterized protein n=1 Tax=Buddleja alternifolia TaxID=168488 RepID=A0AAV6Y4P4_9LAMI|nr:hypothetical protein BUALT_Bualt02G0078200 [Buddleja alternifolia]